MTRADFFIRSQKLKEMSKPKPDDIVFQGIQIVMLGALFGLIGITALVGIIEQGR